MNKYSNFQILRGTTQKIKESEELLLPGQPLIDLQTKELYVGTSANTKIKDSTPITTSNLINGSGEGSVIQKTIPGTETPYNNTASGSGSIALGKDVHALGNTATVIGQNNIANENASGSLTAGVHLINNGSEGTIVLGKYNDETSTALFQVGGGSHDDPSAPVIRQNVFEVLADGRAKVKTAPKDNNDVPRLAELNNKVNISDNFVKVFTIPNGASSGTLTADVKQKLCNPDGHNYYVYDDTSEMILKYSFNEDNEIIQYKAAYLQNDKAYEITMQILPSNGSWRRSQTVLNGATANPTLTGTEVELTGLKVGGTDYKIPSGGLDTIKKGKGKFSEIFNYNSSNASRAEGIYSHAEGYYSEATADYAHAEGDHTYASNWNSHAEGGWNIAPMPTGIIHATGIGSFGDRRDGFEVYKTGEVWCKGPLYVGGVDDSGADIYKLDRTKAKEVATKEYVNTAISNSITKTLNTEV